MWGGRLSWEIRGGFRKMGVCISSMLLGKMESEPDVLQGKQGGGVMHVVKDKRISTK
jgi:hypothetical protein